MIKETIIILNEYGNFMKLLSCTSSYFNLGLISLLLITPIIFNEDNFASAQLVETELEGPIDYEFGVGLFDVGEIDLSTGHYEATFWLSIKTVNGNFTEYMPELHFVNGAITDRSNLYITDNWYNERIQGEFFNTMDFHSYPFSEIDLDIMIEFSQTNDELATFSADPVMSYVFDGIFIPGWTIIDSDFTTTHQEYSELGSYPRYIASYTVETPFLSSFLMNIFPILVIGIMALVTFFYDPKTGFAQKGQILATLVVATIFFQVLSQMNALPSLEYLTLQGKLFAVVYSMLLFSLMETFTQRKLRGHEDIKRGAKINKIFRLSLPIFVIGLFAIIWNF